MAEEPVSDKRELIGTLSGSPEKRIPGSRTDDKELPKSEPSIGSASRYSTADSHIRLETSQPSSSLLHCIHTPMVKWLVTITVLSLVLMSLASLFVSIAALVVSSSGSTKGDCSPSSKNNPSTIHGKLSYISILHSHRKL